MAVADRNIPKALKPVLFKVWGQDYNQHKSQYLDLFDKETSNESFEEIQEVTGYGLAGVKTSGGPTQFDIDSQGVTTRATHVTYSNAFTITMEEQQDNLYINRGIFRTKQLAFSLIQTKETVGANVYNNGFNSSYDVIGDGTSLFSASHPTRSGNQANVLTDASGTAVNPDLSQTALEDMCIKISEAENARGLKIKLLPKALIVPPKLAFEAQRIVQSQLQSDTANNAINVLYNYFPDGVKVNQYLTDDDAFFIRTDVPMGTGLVCFQRMEPSFDEDNDFTTANLNYKAMERYSFTCADFRAVYGSQGA